MLIYLNESVLYLRTTCTNVYIMMLMSMHLSSSIASRQCMTGYVHQVYTTWSDIKWHIAPKVIEVRKSNGCDLLQIYINNCTHPFVLWDKQHGIKFSPPPISVATDLPHLCVLRSMEAWWISILVGGRAPVFAGMVKVWSGGILVAAAAPCTIMSLWL
jgi:hypothetical protein